jgi:hypothetical protein
MLDVFEFILSIISIFLLVVYVIYLDITTELKATDLKTTDVKTTTDTTKTSSDATKTTTSDATTTTTTSDATKTTTSDTDTTTETTDTCKRECKKPTKVTGSCYHPIKYNPLLKKNQEIRSQLICPWQCSSGYSDDPNTCRYDQDCVGCSPTESFPNIDSECPNSTYGCCGDRKTERTDEFGNNCLGVTGCTGSTGATGATGGNCFEGFSRLEEMVSDSVKDNANKYNQQSIPNKTIYPACPNIQCPNESAFQKDTPSKTDVSLGTLPPYPWPVVTDYTTFGV